MNTSKSNHNNTNNPTEPPKLLIIATDPTMLDLLRTTLSYHGYQLRTACPGEDAVATADTWTPHLTVQDGFTITRFHRSQRVHTPALFLSPGNPPHESTHGLTLGGGDYITKPFSPAELLARIRAVLRRTNPHHPSTHDTLRHGELELHEDSHRVQHAGHPIHLTNTEFTLLRFLMENPNKILTRTQILEHVWPYTYVDNSGAVETHMSRLRSKVNNKQTSMIHTIRGIGYILQPPAPKPTR